MYFSQKSSYLLVVPIYVYSISCFLLSRARYPASKVLLKFPRAGLAQSKFALCAVCKADSSFIRAPDTRLPEPSSARAAEKGLRRMKSADITKICLWRRVSADTVISLVEVISEASCRLTGVSEIFPGLCPTMRAAFKAASSLYSRLKQQPLDIVALTFGPTSPPCQRSSPRRLRY